MRFSNTCMNNNNFPMRSSSNTHGYLIFIVFFMRLSSSTLEYLNFANFLARPSPNTHECLDYENLTAFLPFNTRFETTTQVVQISRWERRTIPLFLSAYFLVSRFLEREKKKGEAWVRDFDRLLYGGNWTPYFDLEGLGGFQLEFDVVEAVAGLQGLQLEELKGEKRCPTLQCNGKRRMIGIGLAR